METILSNEVKARRSATYPAHAQFLNRWSPRSMTGEDLSENELFALFEAARWAPSSYNSQPWCFLYAKRGTPAWKIFFNLMIEFNQQWTKNAAVLLVLLSRKTFLKTGKPSPTHSYDTGAAWMSLALEGSLRGLVVHGMSGFDYAKAQKDLNIPQEYHVNAMAAIGRRAPKESLPEGMQEMELPSIRLSVEEIAFEGTFPQHT
jgi:nitroreductase